jgi:hypothetical protein
MKRAEPRQYELSHSAFDQEQQELDEWLGDDDE